MHIGWGLEVDQIENLPGHYRRKPRLKEVIWRALDCLAAKWLWFLAIVSGLLVGWFMAPGDPWIPYYFSSMAQGFGTLLAIVVSAALISFQIGSREYGIGAARLMADSRVTICLAAYTLVILGSSGALGLGAARSPDLHRALAGVVSLSGTVALFETLSIVRGLSRRLSPDLAISALLEKAGHTPWWDYDVASVLARLARTGGSVWQDGLDEYEDGLRRSILSAKQGYRPKLARLLASPLRCTDVLRRLRPGAKDGLVAAVCRVVGAFCVTDPAAAGEIFKALDEGLPDRVSTRVQSEVADTLANLAAARDSATVRYNSLALTRHLAFLSVLGLSRLAQEALGRMEPIEGAELPRHFAPPLAILQRANPKAGLLDSPAAQEALAQMVELRPGELTEIIGLYATAVR